MLNCVIDQISAGKLFQSIGALNIKAVLQGKKKTTKKKFYPRNEKSGQCV